MYYLKPKVQIWTRKPDLFPPPESLPPPSLLTSLMLQPHKLTFNTALPSPNQILSPLPHPSLRQWRMAAFTRLSPLHISLPIRLTTHIHTHRLFIPLSSHLPQTPTHSLFTLFPPGFIVLQFYTPSCALLSHVPVFLSLYFTRYIFFLVRFHIQCCTPLHRAFYTLGESKEDRIRQRNDSGVIVSKGWVGLQYTRLPHQVAMWASFCFYAWRGRERVCMCRPPCNYDCVGRLFWYAAGCFSMHLISRVWIMSKSAC